MLKKICYLLTGLIISIFFACEYPEYEVTYSEVYPVCGEYLVKDYNALTDSLLTEDAYSLYIYNKSYNPTGDSIWIDNATGHPSGAPTPYNYKYKVKCKADLTNLTFDCIKLGNVIGTNVNPLDSAVTITIIESKIFDLSKDITDATADSIYFKFTYFNKYGLELGTFITTGHRKTGWENPEYTDDM
jgi:hypothetical protein